MGQQPDWQANLKIGGSIIALVGGLMTVFLEPLKELASGQAFVLALGFTLACVIALLGASFVLRGASTFAATSLVLVAVFLVAAFAAAQFPNPLPGNTSVPADCDGRYGSCRAPSVSGGPYEF